jgi:DNA repair exonuclease SbcCD ATPase subunit
LDRGKILIRDVSILMAYWLHSERQRRRELADRERGTEDHMGGILGDIFEESEKERQKRRMEELEKEIEELKTELEEVKEEQKKREEELEKRIKELEEELKRRDPFYDAERRLIEIMRMGSGKYFPIRIPHEMDKKLEEIAREKGYKKSEIAKLILDMAIRIHDHKNATAISHL